MSQCIPSVSYIKAAMIGRIRRVRTVSFKTRASGADPSHPAVDICKRMFSYPFQKMEVEYLSRSTVANICKSLRCCSFHPLVPKSGIHLNFLDRKVVFFRPVYNSSFSPPYRGVYTILFDTRCYDGFFARPARKIHYSAPRDIIHVDYNTAAALHYTYKHWYSSARPKPLSK